METTRTAVVDYTCEPCECTWDVSGTIENGMFFEPDDCNDERCPTCGRVGDRT